MFMSLVGGTIRGLLFNITGSCFAGELSTYWFQCVIAKCRPERPRLGSANPV